VSLRSFSRATHRKSPWALTRSVRGAPRAGERASRRREEGPRAGGRWCWRLIALFLISKREKDRVAVAVVLVLPGARFSSLPFAPSTRRELDLVLSRRWMPRCLALQGAGGPAKMDRPTSIHRAAAGGGVFRRSPPFRSQSAQPSRSLSFSRFDLRTPAPSLALSPQSLSVSLSSHICRILKNQNENQNSTSRSSGRGSSRT
jgi:hypothetical protein